MTTSNVGALLVVKSGTAREIAGIVSERGMPFSWYPFTNVDFHTVPLFVQSYAVVVGWLLLVL